MSNIINEFVSQTLQEHGQWLSKQFVHNLERNPNIDSGRLKSEMAAFTLLKEGEHGMEVKFDVPVYGRLMEIRGKKLRKNRNAMRREAKLNGTTLNRRYNRQLKCTDWYAKTMYSGLGRLIAVLCAGISEEQMQRIQTELDLVNKDTAGGAYDAMRAMAKAASSQHH